MECCTEGSEADQTIRHPPSPLIENKLLERKQTSCLSLSTVSYSWSSGLISRSSAFVCLLRPHDLADLCLCHGGTNATLAKKKRSAAAVAAQDLDFLFSFFLLSNLPSPSSDPHYRRRHHQPIILQARICKAAFGICDDRY